MRCQPITRLFVSCLMVLASAQIARAIDVEVGDGVHVGVGPVQVNVGGQGYRPCCPYHTTMLVGLTVKNEAGKDVGKIQDIVVDLGSDRVEYAIYTNALGDKLFAVPFEALAFRHKKDTRYFILPMSANRLKEAPGFNKDHWPSTRDDYWAQVDRFYESSGR